MADYIDPKTIERDDQTFAPKPELVSEQSSTAPGKYLEGRPLEIPGETVRQVVVLSLEETKNLKRSSSYEFLPPSLSELKLVLLGNSWSLKVSVGNLLLRNTEFTGDQECVKGSGTFQEKKLTVICTPDQQLNNSSQQDIKQFIQNIKDLRAPGPHVFLLVLEPEDFTEQHKSRLESVLESFSEEAFHHSLVLMFRPREKAFHQVMMFSSRIGSMEEYIRAPHIRDMIRRCRYRCLWMDYNDLYQNDLKEFKHKQLFSRICDMLKENKEIYGPSEEEDSGLTFSIKNKPSLNLVLFGRRGVGKTYAAASILGREKLTVRSPEQSMKHEGEVSGRRVSLVELPCLSEKPLETVRQLCLDCLSLCDPEGVHAFILVLPGPLTDEDKEEVEILQKTLSTRVRDFTVGLISVWSDADAVNSKESYVNLEALRQICGGGVLCLNIRDPKNITELMDTVVKLAEEGARAYTKDMFLEALIEEAPKSPEMSLRIALIGKSGSNKSATAKTILGEECFSPEPRTKCEKVSRTVHGRTITVVNTPPLFDDSFSEEVSSCVSQLYPGPHAFLLLLPIGEINEQDQDSLKLIKNRLGEKVVDYVIVVFTGGEVLDENNTIKNYIEECDVFVKDMLRQCKNRYHVLNTNETNDTQVAELLKMIDKMAQENSCFTQEMLKMNKVREELKEIRDQLKEAERKIQEKENIETELERLKADAKKAEIQNRKVVEDKSFWIKICLFAILFLLLAIYISATHNNKAIFTIN